MTNIRTFVEKAVQIKQKVYVFKKDGTAMFGRADKFLEDEDIMQIRSGDFIESYSLSEIKAIFRINN